MPHDHSPTADPQAGYLFDARGIDRRFRHAAIFAALNALTPGERMCFVNDHDPLPLLEQIEHYFGQRVSASYREREPGAIVIDFDRVG